MDVKTLCAALSLPREVSDRSTVSCEESLLRRLTCPVHGQDAYRTLAERLGADDMAMLACQLRAACRTYKRYLEKGIPERVFFDTMGCYRRFLEEAHRMHGCWKFDRAWWTWRQLGMRLFRIGQLEYEILYDKKVISMHIPSDAVLTEQNVRDSVKAARKFFREFFPRCRHWLFVCNSWLLAPELKKLLAAGSNILKFQKRFLILNRNDEAKDHMQWLFGVEENAPLESLPENTSLQKNAKAHLLGGGRIGTALGVLIDY